MAVSYEPALCLAGSSSPSQTSRFSASAKAARWATNASCSLTSRAVRGSFSASASSVGTPAATRAASSRAARARRLPSSFCSVLAPQVGHLVDGQQRVGVDVGRAGAPAVLEEPAPHHRQRRGDAVQVQVIAFAGRQRLAVAVAAVGREAAVNRAIRVLQRGPLRTRLIGQHARHPAVREIDDRQPARAGGGRVDDPFRTADNLDRALLQRQVRNGRQRVGILGGQRAPRPIATVANRVTPTRTIRTVRRTSSCVLYAP